MTETTFCLHSWPRAILHADGDAFFTSCEEVMHPELRGKPLVTGAERGIVSCPNYIAKKLGVRRGVSLREAKALCPGLILLPSDYESYSLFSKRMFDIIRQFTPQVEEYSIDEAFADLTGMRRALHASYDVIARQIKTQIHQKLGLTVSVGLSISKVLAKVASKHQKPDGLTLIPGRAIPDYLRDLPVGKRSGGSDAPQRNTSTRWELEPALQFAVLSEETVRRRFTKPGIEIWRELRGESVSAVIPEAKRTYASICKSRTFSPPTRQPDMLSAHLMRNLESACIKTRRYGLAPGKIAVFLKQNDFNISGTEAKLARPCVYPLELSELLRGLFNDIYDKRALYRSNVCCFARPRFPTNLSSIRFSRSPCMPRASKTSMRRPIFSTANYGKHTLHLGGAHLIDQFGKGRRGGADRSGKDALLRRDPPQTFETSDCECQNEKNGCTSEFETG